MHWPRANLSVFEAILARRSVRSYRAGEVDRNTIRTLLEAAVRAPTAAHLEPWGFVVLQGRQLLRSLSDLAKPSLVEEAARVAAPKDDTTAGNATAQLIAQPDFNIFHDASALIVICARPVGAFAAADCWLAGENIMLAACALGLGTCVIGSALPALERPEMKARLGIPEDWLPVAPLVVGYPSGETPATSRHEPRILAWH